MERGHKDQHPGNLRSRRERPSEEWISVPVPALVDPELRRLAQEQLARNREKATRNNTKHDYLLRNLLVCGQCGRRLIGVWSAAGQGRYVCSARYPRAAAWACAGRSLSAARVEQQVWDYVQGLLSDQDLLRSRYEESQGDPAVQPREEQERERIERKLEAVAREVQRLIDAYQAGAIELIELQERQRRSEEQNQLLRRRWAELQQRRQEREQEIRLLQGLEAFRASIQAALVEPSFTTKQKILELVVDCIVVEDTKLTIRHIVPTGPVRLRTEPRVATTPLLGRKSKCESSARCACSLRIQGIPGADGGDTRFLRLTIQSVEENALVFAVPTAAGGQRRAGVGSQEGRSKTQAEEKQQQQGNAAQQAFMI